MNTNDWRSIWKNLGGYWKFDHDHDPAIQPHAILTSGNHSDGYGNSRVISANPCAVTRAALDMWDAFLQERPLNLPQAVFAPETSAPPFAEEIKRYKSVPFGSIEKDGTINWPKNVKKVRTALVIEDVVTTGGSVVKAIKALEDAGVVVLPYVPVILNRNTDGKDYLEDESGNTLAMRILPLIKEPMNIWPSEECPLCCKDSTAYRPKENWSLFAGS
ncbi:MAG: hypothetical protein WDZ82_03060 [Candidatus Paceibacterota bacterium]